MFLLVVGLAGVFVALTCYRMAMQRTTLVLGRLLAELPGNELGAGVQDAITPRAQTRRNFLMFSLPFVIFAIAAYAYTWYHGLLIVALCLVAVPFVQFFGGPREGSPRLVAAIVSDLKRRREAYTGVHDASRVEAINFLLGKMASISAEQIEREVRKLKGF